MNLISLADLTPADIHAIWARVGRPAPRLEGTVGWSFEGNGIRTRTSFIQAFQQLGLNYIELPNLLKTPERVEDLAGYLDSFYNAYVIRESNHVRLAAFAATSSRPVINAMSSRGHPCEVLTDAYFIQHQIGDLQKLKVGLWGATTNVFRSWHELAAVLGFTVHQFCPASFARDIPNVPFHTQPDTAVDVLITDGWPEGFDDPAWSLTLEHLEQLGNPKLLPTPPFTIGKELAFDPVKFENFVGYEQKHLLLAVQKAILIHLLE